MINTLQDASNFFLGVFYCLPVSLQYLILLILGVSLIFLVVKVVF